MAELITFVLVSLETGCTHKWTVRGVDVLELFDHADGLTQVKARSNRLIVVAAHHAVVNALLDKKRHVQLNPTTEQLSEALAAMRKQTEEAKQREALRPRSPLEDVILRAVGAPEESEH